MISLRSLSLLFWLGMALFVGGHRALGDPPIGLVSGGGGNSRSAGGDSAQPTFSPDSKHIAFVSRAQNLVSGKSSTFTWNVYSKDVFRPGPDVRTDLISESRLGGRGGNGSSYSPSVSSNGLFVAFESDASDLVDGDTNSVADIFVRDVVAGTNILVSLNALGTGSGNGASRNPFISGDGRWVAFESQASDLLTNQFQFRTFHLHVRDLRSSVTFFVFPPVLNSGKISALGERLVGISSGRPWIFFQSSDPSLFLGGGAHPFGLFARDPSNGEIRWASRPPPNSGTNLNVILGSPVISGDGHFVAFLAQPSLSRDSTTNLFRHSLDAATTEFIQSGPITGPLSISADGRYVAYMLSNNLYRWDSSIGSNEVFAITGATSLLKTNRGAQWPILTPDGSEVAVSVLRDHWLLLGVNLDSKSNTCLTVTTKDTESGFDTDLAPPVFSPDGQWIAWESAASDLVADDSNEATDVFLHKVFDGKTQLVSERAAEMSPVSRLASSRGGFGTISATGEKIAYTWSDPDPRAAAETNASVESFSKKIAVFDQNRQVSALMSPSTNRAYFGEAAPVLSRNGLTITFARIYRPAWEALFADLFQQDLITGAVRQLNLLSDGRSAMDNNQGLSLNPDLPCHL